MRCIDDDGAHGLRVSDRLVHAGQLIEHRGVGFRWICPTGLRSRTRPSRWRADHREGQEQVDRDEDREQIEAAPAQQRVVQQQHAEEGQQQAAVVAAPGLEQGVSDGQDSRLSGGEDAFLH